VEVAAPGAAEPADVDLGERVEEKPVEPADVDLEEVGIGRRRQAQELTGVAISGEHCSR